MDESVNLFSVLSRSKDGTELEDGAKYTLTYKDTIASLFIHGLEPEDSGRVTCKATNDMGSVKTSANLTIEEVRHRRRQKEAAEAAFKKKK